MKPILCIITLIRVGCLCIGTMKRSPYVALIHSLKPLYCQTLDFHFDIVGRSLGNNFIMKYINKTRKFSDASTINGRCKWWAPRTCLLSDYESAVDKVPSVDRTENTRANNQTRCVLFISWHRNRSGITIHANVNHNRRCRAVSAIGKQKFLKVRHTRKSTIFVCPKTNTIKNCHKIQYPLSRRILEKILSENNLLLPECRCHYGPECWRIKHLSSLHNIFFCKWS